MSAVPYRRMRVDVLLCLGLAYLLSMGTGKLAGLAASATYDSYVAAHTAAPGEIGGQAGGEVFRAQSIQDLLSHDTFTVISPGIEYKNRGGGYYEGRYFHLLTLPSGELVAARINEVGVQYEGEFYTSDKVLPVGRVVKEALYQDHTFLDQIQSSWPLTRSDFYIDMMGNGGALNLESYISGPKSLTQIITVCLMFPVFHILGVKIGVLPPIFPPRRPKDQRI